MLIQQFVTFCGAANLGVARQLIYLQKIAASLKLLDGDTEIFVIN
jgi:hypothetical protein